MRTTLRAQAQAVRDRAVARYDLLLAYAGCQPPPPEGLLSCAELVERTAEINATYDAFIAALADLGLTPAQREVVVAEIEAQRAAELAFNQRLLAAAGCRQPPICANPPAPLSGAIIAHPGTVTVGTSGDDVIYGTAGDDRIAGMGGNDLIFGLGGNDQISGGAGDDVICGGDGNDFLAGNDGNDVVSGDAGDDAISGGAGNDRLSGGPGTNQLAGNDGADDCDPGGTPASAANGCEFVLGAS